MLIFLYLKTLLYHVMQQETKYTKRFGTCHFSTTEMNSNGIDLLSCAYLATSSSTFQVGILKEQSFLHGS